MKVIYLKALKSLKAFYVDTKYELDAIWSSFDGDVI